MISNHVVYRIVYQPQLLMEMVYEKDRKDIMKKDKNCKESLVNNIRCEIIDISFICVEFKNPMMQ